MSEATRSDVCEAEGCTRRGLTWFGDGEREIDWWLCEHHGDLLGFQNIAMKDGVRGTDWQRLEANGPSGEACTSGSIPAPCLGVGDDDTRQVNLARQGSSVAVEQGSGPSPHAPRKPDLCGGCGWPIHVATDECWWSDKSACAYFQGTGSCSFGCTTEPSCQTDRPDGGWPGEVVHSA